MPLFTIQGSQYEGVPAGNYIGVFKALDACETSKGKAYRWKFEIIEGEHKGRIVSELSDGVSPPTTKNKTGRFLVALSKQSLTAGVQVDPDKYVGRKYLIICEPKDSNSGTKITTFSAI